MASIMEIQSCLNSNIQRCHTWTGKIDCLILWLANYYFAHDSSGFSVLQPFCDAQSGCSFQRAAALHFEGIICLQGSDRPLDCRSLQF